MSSEEYAIAWAIYLAGASICYWVMCVATRWITWFELRGLIKIFFAALLFVPAYSAPPQSYLAPASIVVVFDLMSQEPGLGVRGVKLLLVVMALLAVVVLLEGTVRRWWRARRL